MTAQTGDKEGLDTLREQLGSAMGTPLMFEEEASSPEDILKFLKGS